MRELSPPLTFYCRNCGQPTRLFPVSRRGYTLICTCSTEYKIALDHDRSSGIPRVLWLHIPKFPGDRLERGPYSNERGSLRS